MEGVPEYLFLHRSIKRTHVNLAISCIPQSATLDVFKQKASDVADSAQGAMAPTGFS
jgi:hypothetical protein